MADEEQLHIKRALAQAFEDGRKGLNKQRSVISGLKVIRTGFNKLNSRKSAQAQQFRRQVKSNE